MHATVWVEVVCDCSPDGGAKCLTAATFTGTDRIDAITNARLAGWGVRDDGAARCPGCKAKKVMFPRAVYNPGRKGESRRTAAPEGMR